MKTEMDTHGPGILVALLEDIRSVSPQLGKHSALETMLGRVRGRGTPTVPADQSGHSGLILGKSVTRRSRVEGKARQWKLQRKVLTEEL